MLYFLYLSFNYSNTMETSEINDSCTSHQTSTNRPRRLPFSTPTGYEIPKTSSACCCANSHSLDGYSEQSLCSCSDNDERKTFSRMNNNLLPSKAVLGCGPSAFRNYRCTAFTDPVNFNNCVSNNTNTECGHPNETRNAKYEMKPYGPTRTQEQTFEEIVKPLSTERLRAIRQKTRNVVFSILEDKTITLEFIQNHNSEEYVLEILKISSDGMRVTLFYPGGEFGILLQDAVMQLPSSARTYEYDTLPKELWHKYQLADNFVRLVKTRTPKVSKEILV